MKYYFLSYELESKIISVRASLCCEIVHFSEKLYIITTKEVSLRMRVLKHTHKGRGGVNINDFFF